MAKPEQERPIGVRYWLATDMIEWIKANTKLEDPEYAARWWLGCEWVEGFNDMNGRERTELIVDGSKAIDLDDVSGRLQQDFDGEFGEAPTAEEHNTTLEEDWRTFWRHELK